MKPLIQSMPLREVAPLAQPTLAPAPDVAPDRGRLVALIKRSVQYRTGDGIRNLAVEIGPDGVLLNGHCDSFYCKQLAQVAAMRLAKPEQVFNQIEVD